MELLLSLRCLVPPGTRDSTAGFLPSLCPLYTPNSRQISPKLPESLGNVGYGRYVSFKEKQFKCSWLSKEFVSNSYRPQLPQIWK